MVFDASLVISSWWWFNHMQSKFKESSSTSITLSTLGFPLIHLFGILQEEAYSWMIHPLS
jgi:hypothetical protein